MCHELFHRCRYCGHDYDCPLEDIECPTINEDMNRNLCINCTNELENELSKLKSYEVTSKDIDDLIGE